MDINMFLLILTAAIAKIIPLVINITCALLMLLFGYVVAKGVSWLVVILLKTALLDLGAKKIGFNTILEKGELKKSPSELVGEAFYWSIIFITVIGVANVFTLPIEPALNKLILYFGLVFVAALVLGLGAFFASLLSGIVRIVAINFGVEGAKTLSRVVYYIVLIFTFIAALAQLGINPDVFVPQIGVIIGAVGLAAAIAFGLGCKDMAADFLHNLFKSR